MNSIKSFTPSIKNNIDFENIIGEDPNITTIRKYYWLISTGKLQDAYAMYANQKGITFDTFKGWYENVYLAKPDAFKKTSDAQYEFIVQYQEHNTDPTKYRVVMSIADGKITTKSSEEILTKEATLGDYKAYAIKKGGKNYVMLTKNGVETVVDQGVAEYDKDYTNIGAVKFFSNVNFSPDGKYLTYMMTGWEWGQAYVYDITTKKIVFTQDSPGDFLFSADGKYFVSCAASDFDGTRAGLVFSSNDFKNQIFDILKYDTKINNDYSSIDCKIENGVVDISLNNDNWEGEGKDQKPANKVIQYSLSDKKIIK